MLIYYTIHIAGLLIAPSHTSTKYKMEKIFGLTYELSFTGSVSSDPRYFMVHENGDNKGEPRDDTYKEFCSWMNQTI